MPNLAVDMNSWARSACYPRRTFYPLSVGASTRSRRITKSCFRTCSTCKSRSQAPFCFYTRRTITDRAEGTIESLRYILGGDRPSQTTRLTLSPTLIQGSRLEFEQIKGGISHFGSTMTSATASKPPTYSTHNLSKPNAKVQ